MPDMRRACCKSWLVKRFSRNATVDIKDWVIFTVILKRRATGRMQMAWQGESAGVNLVKPDVPGNRPTVAVIIPAFNHAQFLPDAIRSVLAQTRPADEIIVVDDGSMDDPAAAIAQFKNVRLIRQDNRGPSGARNTGLRNCTATYVVFLDADDRLLPRALESGLACITSRPDCAFVYGGHRLVSADGRPLAPDCYNPIGGDVHLAFLRGNPIGMHAAVLYRRDRLLEVNGFDETLRLVEDYDLYLRIAQRYPVASHPTIIAEYRQHDRNTSTGNLKKMYLSGRIVLDRHKMRIASDAAALEALEKRQTERRADYVREMLSVARVNWTTRHFRKIIWNLVQAIQLSPFHTLRLVLRTSARSGIDWIDDNLGAVLPDNFLILLRFIARHGYLPSVKNPKTFSEWLNKTKLLDRNPLLTQTTDKFAVRDYVREKCGEKFLIPLFQVANCAEDINFETLPNQFILKPTHASGLVEIVKDKSLIDKNELLPRLRTWLNTDFYRANLEWQYKNIPPRIIAEELLLDKNGQPPRDYKFYVFRGSVRLIHIDVDRFLRHRSSLFDRDWNLLQVTFEGTPATDGQPMPSRLHEMIEIAEILGSEFVFARIDLYEHDNRIYFGEITHTPGAGVDRFNPREFDLALGEMLNSGAPIPARYYASFRREP